MKKETVIKLLNKSERQAKKARCQAQVNAVSQCRKWLATTWTEMLTHVNAKLEELDTKAQPLIEKEEQQQPMTEQEQQRLQELRDVYAIYYAFYQKIYPTARRATVERGIRERERAARKQY